MGRRKREGGNDQTECHVCVLTSSLLLGLCLCLCSVQLLVVGGPSCLVVGVRLRLALSSRCGCCLLVRVLACPGVGRRSSARSPVHWSRLRTAKHLGTLIGTTGGREGGREGQRERERKERRDSERREGEEIGKEGG